MKLEMPAFQDARLLVIGDVMLDRYWHGAATRVSPEAPVPVPAKLTIVRIVPERAGNVALNIAALGSAARLVGIIGRDDTGQDLRSRLTAAGVYCDFLESADKPTITKLRVISQHQQLIRLDFEQLFDKTDIAGLNERAEALMSDVQAVVMSDYAKGRAARYPVADCRGAQAGHSGDSRSQRNGLWPLSWCDFDHAEYFRAGGRGRPL